MIAALLLAIASGALAVHLWSGTGPAKADTTVIVPVGASLNRAADALEKAGTVRSARMFVLFSKILGSGEPIKAGEYRFKAGESQSNILTLMQSGRTLQRMVTITPGMPSILAYEALMKADHLTGDAAIPAEGSLLPDSYAYNRGDTRQSVLDRMQKAMRDYLAAAWARRSPGIAVTTPEQAVILASIIEKETGKPSERRLVAGVYSNRLKRGMKLQADPTIIYPITRGKPLGRRILRSEIDAVNDYNTYSMVGLPKGPIANPSRESIDAALNPERTNSVYFVADGTGGHVFADTLDQHNANVAKWRDIRRARGEIQ